MSDEYGSDASNLFQRIRLKVIGPPRDIRDPRIFHKIALIPFFAWVGLGADGLSSSAYGPEEAFRTLGTHIWMAIFLGLATAFTVIVIAYTYTKIIERFPLGGGGYIVATKMLGKRAGVVSGSALIIDYILTITVSIVSSSDAIFSYLPIAWLPWKIWVSGALIALMVLLNIRGVKESITILAPIFMVFIVTHVFLLIYGLASRSGAVPELVRNIGTGYRSDLSGIGLLGMALIFLRAYSLGGGTYTGIEAVSNGMQIMREPKVRNGKKTMAYLAASLAVTAGGLLVIYLLTRIVPQNGRTLNATLADALYGGFGGVGKILAFITILSEGTLLLVASQAGFIDAPRVMANMAVDSWLPRRFADFSSRLTMRNGIVMIGISAVVMLVYTKGSISALVVMYSINVFLTFSLSEFGMVKHFIQNRRNEKIPLRSILVQALGFVLSALILCLTVFEKFTEGGWLTLLITGLLILLCMAVKRHYLQVGTVLKKLDSLVEAVELEKGGKRARKVDPREPTAIQLVSGYNGLGVHTFLQICTAFPGHYRNFIFASAGIVDQEIFKDGESVPELLSEVDVSLQRYILLAHKYGFAADAKAAVGTSVVDTATELCRSLSKEFPNSTVFSGNLVFSRERLVHRILHNETAFAVQKRLQWEGITNVVMPIRVR
ncbi:MAG: APC family permease [Rectinemataceae bacterium]